MNAGRIPSAARRSPQERRIDAQFRKRIVRNFVVRLPELLILSDVTICLSELRMFAFACWKRGDAALKKYSLFLMKRTTESYTQLRGC